MPWTLESFPKAILHIDGDSFFASCEVALNPKLRGKPVVTGSERGIASALTYEAKKLGIKRGMPIKEIRRRFPSVIIMPSDYETYSLFSERMYSIVRRYTPDVEEYGIDECFADLSGLRRTLRMSYQDIARAIKHDLEVELGMTFSIGLAPTKVLAKIASKWKKPDGLTIIPARDAVRYLKSLPTGKLWGIGPNTSSYLKKFGINTAYELALKSPEWVREKLSKPFQEIYRELKGEQVYELDLEKKHVYKSISKTKTFTPSSRDRDYIFSQLSKNIENACIKARRHGLTSPEIFIFLKTQNFRYHGMELKLNRSTAVPTEMIQVAGEFFDKLFRVGVDYRATGVVLMKLGESSRGQLDLFGGAIRAEAYMRIYESIDHLSNKFGKHTVYLGSSYKAMNSSYSNDRRKIESDRKSNLFKNETFRKRVGIPMLGIVR